MKYNPPKNLVFDTKEYELEDYFCAVRINDYELFALSKLEERELLDYYQKELLAYIRAKLIYDGEETVPYDTGCKVFRKPATLFEYLKYDLQKLVIKNGLEKTWLVSFFEPKYEKETFWFSTQCNNKYYTLVIAPPNTRNYKTVELKT